MVRKGIREGDNIQTDVNDIEECCSRGSNKYKDSEVCIVWIVYKNTLIITCETICRKIDASSCKATYYTV